MVAPSVDCRDVSEPDESALASEERTGKPLHRAGLSARRLLRTILPDHRKAEATPRARPRARRGRAVLDDGDDAREDGSHGRYSAVRTSSDMMMPIGRSRCGGLATPKRAFSTLDVGDQLFD
jgi:hypothetical protein